MKKKCYKILNNKIQTTLYSLSKVQYMTKQFRHSRMCSRMWQIDNITFLHSKM